MPVFDLVTIFFAKSPGGRYSQHSLILDEDSQGLVVESKLIQLRRHLILFYLLNETLMLSVQNKERQLTTCINVPWFNHIKLNAFDFSLFVFCAKD